MTTYANKKAPRPEVASPPAAVGRRRSLSIALALGLAAIPGGVSARQSIKQPNRALPTVISEEERLEVVAVPATVAPAIDGVLDEAIWRADPPVEGFIQSEPDEGLPATERTQVWVAFDTDYLYIAAHLHDADRDGIVVSDIRKDFRIDNQDAFEVIIDTFGDRRNGYAFATNPAGARADRQVTNEGRAVDASWDAPWSVRTQLVADGWTLEMVIPFNSIRSAKGDEGTWGINFSRRIRRKNEVAFWAPVPRAYAITRLSLAGNLTGLGSVKRGLDLRITPYVSGKTVRETGGAAFDENADAGVDFKFGLTDGLTLDVTVNPDFAQVEADVQQVNLTQFSQFFPEKREFFLENSGLFYIGDTPRNRRVTTAPQGNEDLVLFFSRRMGLAEDGRLIPIDGGVRLSGQEGGFQVGALALRSREEGAAPANDYAVVRLRHNMFSNSDVGGLFMIRSAVHDRGNVNRVYGADANIRLPGQVDWSSFFLNSDSRGLSGSQYAYQTSFNREGNFVHVKFGLLSIGENFNNDLGFLRRTGIRKWSIDTGIRPRSTGLRKRGVREMHPHIAWNYYTDLSGNEVAKRLHTGYSFFFNNGGFSELSINPRGELLTQPFQINSAVPAIQSGKYDWTEYMFRYNSDASRLLSATFTGIIGGLWTGTQRTIRTTVTVTPSYKFRASLGVSRTAGNLEGPNGKFVQEIWTARANYSFTTNMFIDALAQYDADRKRFNANVRFNLIHHALSNLFIVYNEQRFVTDGGPAPGRSIIVKVTQMLSY